MVDINTIKHHTSTNITSLTETSEHADVKLTTSNIPKYSSVYSVLEVDQENDDTDTDDDKSNNIEIDNIVSKPLDIIPSSNNNPDISTTNVMKHRSVELSTVDKDLRSDASIPINGAIGAAVSSIVQSKQRNMWYYILYLLKLCIY